MRLRAGAVLCAWSLLLATVVGASEMRVALVIGNSAYAGAPLRNPVNDARAVREALIRSDFQVLYYENLVHAEMESALRAFRAKLTKNGIALFYYAGHGAQEQKQNYLIPLNSNIRAGFEMPFRALSVAQVLGAMEEVNSGLNMVFLDACRNNPFTSYRSAVRGISVVGRVPQTTLISYSTAPNRVAEDGDGEDGDVEAGFLCATRIPQVSAFAFTPVPAANGSSKNKPQNAVVSGGCRRLGIERDRGREFIDPRRV
ncbi:MAG TPA: caspase family protein, partial [Myxococcales bacterium]|nr:caspase family protein [Myxococcales bacterium]